MLRKLSSIDVELLRRMSSIDLMDQKSARLKASIARVLKPAMFVMALCATVALFTLPVIFYYITAYTDQDYSLTPTGSVDKNISIGNGSAVSCDAIHWAVDDDSTEQESLVCEVYTGTVCLQYLTEWNQCLHPSKTELEIVVNGGGKTQTELDEEINQLRFLLESFPECQVIAIPFVCHYFFPLTTAASCQEYSNNNEPPLPADNDPPLLYTVTQEECVYMQDTVCAVPWSLAASIGYEDRIPDCMTLPTNANSSTDSSDLGLLNNISSSPITCRSDFISINNTCYPRCDRFEEQDHILIKVMVISEIFSSIVGLVLSVTAIVLSIYNRKTMFKFPSIFLVFFCVDICVFAFIVLVSAFDRYNLLCSSVNLIEAVDNPTAFCTISGMAFQYLFINMAMWWFFHLCVFLYEIVFPFHAHRFKKLGRTKYLAIALTILGLSIPVPGVIIALAWESHGYRLVRFPPTICITDEDMWFYSMTFPFSVAIATGVCLLISVLWLIHVKNRSSTTHRAHKKRALTTAEKKMMIVFVWFVLFAVVSLVHYGIVSGNGNKVFHEYVKYFLCESTGHVPGKCDRSGFEQYLYPQMTITTYLLMGLMPIPILNFILNWGMCCKSGKQNFNAVRTRMSSGLSLGTSQTQL